LLFQLLRRARLSDDGLPKLCPRVVAIVLLAWLPLLSALGVTREQPYMDAPGLPSFQFMMAGREDCTRTSGLSLRHRRCP
jgi:hypothetical protein